MIMMMNNSEVAVYNQLNAKMQKTEVIKNGLTVFTVLIEWLLHIYMALIHFRELVILLQNGYDTMLGPNYKKILRFVVRLS